MSLNYISTKFGENLLFEKESYLVRGACFEVYNKFGGAFKESVVQNALVVELEQRGFRVETQKRIDVVYKDKKVGAYVPDIVIDDKIIIELKVKPLITREDERQFWYYLRESNYRLGFLINFSPQELQIFRRVYEKSRLENRNVSATIRV